MHAQEDAASHQERKCAIALARAAARRAIASLQGRMATKPSAPAMPSLKHMEISPSVLECVSWK